MKLSVLIPAQNEEVSISSTVKTIHTTLTQNGIDSEILVIDDYSSDQTKQVVTSLSNEIPTLRCESNINPPGFGFAVRMGLNRFTGDCVAIMMADASDSPEDLIRFYNKMVLEGCDCVFGSRFTKEGSVENYPIAKLFLNRVVNNIVRLCFGIKYNDCTNAFKLYKRETIIGLEPFLSPSFNLTLELPLKAIVRGYSYEVLPNSWKGRLHGISKLKIKELGSRYFFILLYCLIERYFSKGDFRKKMLKTNNCIVNEVDFLPSPTKNHEKNLRQHPRNYRQHALGSIKQYHQRR